MQAFEPQWPRPKRINFIRANRCNLRCTYCPEGSHPDSYYADLENTSFEEITKRKKSVAWIDSRRRLLQLGLEAVPNTPEEIASGVEEMLARMRGGWSESRDDVLQRHRLLALLGSMGISGRGSLSRKFMQNHAATHLSNSTGTIALWPGCGNG